MKLVTSDVSVVNQKNDLNGIFEHIELIGKTCYKSVVKGGETALEFVKKLISNGHFAMLEHGTCYLFVENYDDSVDDGYLYLRYLNNPYSWVEKLDNNLYITTNYRVIVEHGWERDLGYLCEPGPYHKRRVSAKFICSRAVANEIVRHRVFSYAQESTRYCNYSKDKFGNEIQVIIPEWINDRIAKNNLKMMEKQDAIEILEDKYDDILEYVTTAECLNATYNDMINRGLSAQCARGILPLDLKTEIWMTGFRDDFNHFFDLRASEKFGKPHPDIMVLANKLQDIIDE